MWWGVWSEVQIVCIWSSWCHWVKSEKQIPFTHVSVVKNFMQKNSYYYNLQLFVMTIWSQLGNDDCVSTLTQQQYSFCTCSFFLAGPICAFGSWLRKLWRCSRRFLKASPSYLASVKSRSVLPFWYLLTQVVLEKRPLSGFSSSSSSSSRSSSSRRSSFSSCFKTEPLAQAGCHRASSVSALKITLWSPAFLIHQMRKGDIELPLLAVWRHLSRWGV